MTKQTEEKLRAYKKSIVETEIHTMRLDDAIAKGFSRAKVETMRRPKRRTIFFGVAALLLLLVGWVASVRIIELVNHNKGYMAAIENDYYQKLGLVDKYDGVTFTIDGAIADETGFVLFYVIEADEKYREFNARNLTIKDRNGNDLRGLASYSYGGPHYSEKGQRKFYGMMDFTFQDHLPTYDFQIEFDVVGARKVTGGGSFQHVFQMPIHLNETDIATKKVYALQETVDIDGQKMMIDKVTVNPLRVGIDIVLDEANTWEVLDFSDIRLEDEKGEEWGSIVDGVSAHSSEDTNRRTIYLQSNYFHNPSKLSLVLNRIQAIPKAERTVVVDLDTESIVAQPKEKNFSRFYMHANDLVFELEVEGFPFSPFSTVKDESGKELDTPSMSHSSMENDHGKTVNKYHIHVRGLQDRKGKLYLPLAYYPSWLESEEEIRISIP